MVGWFFLLGWLAHILAGIDAACYRAERTLIGWLAYQITPAMRTQRLAREAAGFDCGTVRGPPGSPPGPGLSPECTPERVPRHGRSVEPPTHPGTYPRSRIPLDLGRCETYHTSVESRTTRPALPADPGHRGAGREARQTGDAMTTIMVDARRYEDQDDCLAAAAHDVATQYDVAGWDLAPRWADDSRARIVLHLPAAARAWP